MEDSFNYTPLTVIELNIDIKRYDVSTITFDKD